MTLRTRRLVQFLLYHLENYVGTCNLAIGQFNGIANINFSNQKIPRFEWDANGYFLCTVWKVLSRSSVGHKSHEPCFHNKYVEAEVMTFVAHCTVRTYTSSRSMAEGNDNKRVIVVIMPSEPPFRAELLWFGEIFFVPEVHDRAQVQVSLQLKSN